jgi:hypothetical protein
MLNRTNLTLSDLSNRLNLGTRSLVLTTSTNGANALRIRHFHHDVMRDSMVWYVVSPSKYVKHDIPPVPGSIIPGPQQRPIRFACQQSSLQHCAARTPLRLSAKRANSGGAVRRTAGSAMAARAAAAEG